MSFFPRAPSLIPPLRFTAAEVPEAVILIPAGTQFSMLEGILDGTRLHFSHDNYVTVDGCSPPRLTSIDVAGTPDECLAIINAGVVACIEAAREAEKADALARAEYAKKMRLQAHAVSLEGLDESGDAGMLGLPYQQPGFIPGYMPNRRGF